MYVYCLLPSGNEGEFPDLDAELKTRNVTASVHGLSTGGRIYRVARNQLSKLPSDAKGPYLGDDSSGHSLYTMSDIEATLKQFGDDKGWIPAWVQS